MAAAETTILDYGLQVSDVWPNLEATPMYLTVLGAAALPVVIQAVVILATEEEYVAVVPAAFATGATTWGFGVEGDASGTSFVQGVFGRLPAATVLTSSMEAPPDSLPLAFDSEGGWPSTTSVLAQLPLGLLPEDVQSSLLALAEGDELDPEDAAYGEPLTTEAPGAAPPPGGGHFDLGLPAVQPSAGGELLLGPGPPALPPPPAGRGRGLPDQPPPPPAKKAGAGRGRGGGGPKASMATLSAQLAQLLDGQRSFEARVGALEEHMAAGSGPAAATPRSYATAASGPSGLTAKASVLDPVAINALIGPPPARSGPVGEVARRPVWLGSEVPKVSFPTRPPPPLNLQTAQPAAQPQRSAPQQPRPPPGLGVAGAPVAKPAGAPPPQPLQQDQMEAFLRTLQAQATALTTLAAHGGVHGDEPDLLGGAPSDAFSLRSMGGARGAAAMEMHRRELRDNPGRVAGKIRANRDRCLTGNAVLPGVVNTFRGYFTSEVPFGQARTAAYMCFGMVEVADLMASGNWEHAEATLLLLLAATEQAALQEWQWGAAWLLTHLPDPPWQRIRYAPARDSIRPLSRLADPALAAAAVAYLRDMAVLGDAQKRQFGGKPETTQDAAKHKGDPKSKPKGPKGKGKGAEPAQPGAEDGA